MQGPIKPCLPKVSGFSNEDIEGDTSKELHSRLSQLNMSYEREASPGGASPGSSPGAFSPPLVQNSYITDMMAR